MTISRFLDTAQPFDPDDTTSLYNNRTTTQAKPADGTATGTGVFETSGVSHAILTANIASGDTATISLHGYVKAVGRWGKIVGWGTSGSYSLASDDDLCLSVDVLGYDAVCVAIDAISASTGLKVDATLSQETRA